MKNVPAEAIRRITNVFKAQNGARSKIINFNLWDLI